MQADLARPRQGWNYARQGQSIEHWVLDSPERSRALRSAVVQEHVAVPIPGVFQRDVLDARSRWIEPRAPHDLLPLEANGNEAQPPVARP